MSKIEWTEKTWNPIVGCSKVSPGCANCYAERMANRLSSMENCNGFTAYNKVVNLSGYEESDWRCTECGKIGGDWFVGCPGCGQGWAEPEKHYSIHGLVDWVICGGESGPGARPMHPDWARSLRDQCKEAGVPFFFKQWGEYLPNGQDIFLPTTKPKVYVDGACNFVKVGKKKAGRLLDGVEHRKYPEVVK